jgi:hypothetical protein
MSDYKRDIIKGIFVLLIFLSLVSIAGPDLRQEDHLGFAKACYEQIDQYKHSQASRYDYRLGVLKEDIDRYIKAWGDTPLVTEHNYLPGYSRWDAKVEEIDYAGRAIISTRIRIIHELMVGVASDWVAPETSKEYIYFTCLNRAEERNDYTEVIAFFEYTARETSIHVIEPANYWDGLTSADNNYCSEFKYYEKHHEPLEGSEFAGRCKLIEDTNRTEFDASNETLIPAKCSKCSKAKTYFQKQPRYNFVFDVPKA